MHGLDILTQLFLLCVAIGTVALLWARVVAPMLHAFGVRHWSLYVLYVKPEELDAPQTAQTGRQTQTDSPSDAPERPETHDRDITLLDIPPGSRERLIELLVRAEWPVGAIRAVVKGDNNVISEEVSAARVRLGLGSGSIRTVTVTEHGKPVREIEL